MSIITHDLVNTSGGILTPSKKALFGGNALQSIQIARHTPRNPQQAVGHLGTVDFTRGVITSDLQLDAILVEGCVAANPDNKDNSIYRYAAQQVTVGVEEYVLTSFNMGLQAGNPVTIGLGYLTASIASALATHAQPEPEVGEESSYAVVVGDEGDGLVFVPAWASGYNHGALPSGNIAILNENGTIGQVWDRGLPAGIQSVTLSGRINRNNVLDVRSTTPQQFITQYPLDMSVDMNVLDAGTVDWSKLRDLTIRGAGLNQTVVGPYRGGGTKIYAAIFGMTKIDETEGVSVGQFRQFTFNFEASDFVMPMPEIPA